MSHHLRYQSKPWATHHIVSRCIQGFSFLKPTPEIVNACCGVLAYSLHLHRSVIQLHHYAFLSNHFHLLVSSRDASSLAQFMCHFKGILSRELGRIHKWQGPLWQKRYSSEEILDEASLEELFRYITQNSVKEGLVDHPREWHGLHGYHTLIEGRTVTGRRLNRTKFYYAKVRASIRGDSVSASDYTSEYRLLLHPPPMWIKETTEQLKSRLKRLFDDGIQEGLGKRKSSALGMPAVLEQRIYEPRLMKPTPRPLCRSKCPESFKAYQVTYLIFKTKYKEASVALRRSLQRGEFPLQVHFPEGGIPIFCNRFAYG